MNHKQTCAQFTVDIANTLKKNFGDVIKIDMDILISGAILINVGKLIEYEKVDDKIKTSKAGDHVRHPFSGQAIATRFDLSY